MARLEASTAARKERTKQFQQEAQAAQERELVAYKSQQAEVAQKLHVEAKKKLASTIGRTLAVTSQIKQLHDEKYDDRTEAVLELKINIDASRAQLAAQAQKHVHKVQAKAKQLEDSKADLLAQGRNPYEELRRQEIEEEATREEARLRAAVERNKADLAAKLTKERALSDKQEAARRQAEKHAQELRDSLGRHEVEERNRAYIVARTTAHTELLDPSGKLSRVDPSQVTDIPDFTFGLAKSVRIPKESMARITEQIRQSLHADRDDFGVHDRLVAGLVKATQNGAGDIAGHDNASALTASTALHEARLTAGELAKLDSLGNQLGRIPGAEEASTAINLAADSQVAQALLGLTADFEGSIDHHHALGSVSSARYKPVELSKFERSALERARERQRDRIELGTEQIAGGKVFQGDAFVSSPMELVFKDFEVGKVYKQHFTLTNVSYTFNSFKLLPLDDAVLDFFTITFTKPGRMSAGMSCPVDIIFTPQVHQDIFTHLRLLTETGPVEVSCSCLIKRCAPRIVTPFYDFDRVVIGQHLTQTIKISNTQALGSAFTIVAVEEVESALVHEADEASAAEGEPAGEPASAPLQLELEDGDAANDREPAVNAAELWSRVRRIMAAALRQKQAEQSQPFLCYTAHSNASECNADGHIAGYAAASLTVRCAPLTVGNIERHFIVRFRDVDESMSTVDDLQQPVRKEQLIRVVVHGDDLPIYLQEEVVDLKCTLYDRIYRQKVTLHNRGQIACRVTIKLDKAYASYVEVSPTVFFVQAQSNQSVSVKFTPRVDMLQKLSYYTLPNGRYPMAAMIAMPIEVQVRYDMLCRVVLG